MTIPTDTDTDTDTDTGIAGLDPVAGAAFEDARAQALEDLTDVVGRVQGHDFPDRFGCIEDARAWCERFFDW